jgi:hypothetical protein
MPHHNHISLNSTRNIELIYTFNNNKNKTLHEMIHTNTSKSRDVVQKRKKSVETEDTVVYFFSLSLSKSSRLFFLLSLSLQNRDRAERRCAVGNIFTYMSLVFIEHTVDIYVSACAFGCLGM